MEGRRIVQWDKDSCSDAGFLKIDLLGLGMLSAVERCVTLINKTRGESVDLSRIPLDDPPTFEAIRKAETTGVFQIESRAQMSSLLRTQPETLDDITIQVAIVRPGPIQGGAVNPYIANRRRRLVDPNAPITYMHPSLEPVLEETLGTIIFQDQVLEVSTAFAGFTPGEAESLRRAMSRKRSSAAVEAHRERFIAGAAAKHGASEELAVEIFEMIRAFQALDSLRLTLPPLACLPTSPLGCGSITPLSSCALCSTNSRWASTHLTRLSMRLNAEVWAYFQ